uniref:Integrase catalytic domain-containing protein n=1 Tax=Lactuca sativa TaxID=4236 RepID=A0A9R1XEI9_LACSA|nr:hypothetical protein LSAT_V11C500233880 [Lactuca sativa]
MNEMKNNFKNKFVSNSFINQSLIDEYCITNSDGITECNVEITGIDPTSYPAHLVRPIPLTENIIAFPISNGEEISLKVKQLRSDHGTEFRNSTLEEFCDNKGIGQNFSAPRTPQQNGVAKRRNRTMIEAGRTLMIHAVLPMSFWAEAVNTACFTQNRSLIHRIHKKTPYEMLKDRKPDVSYFHVFGCICYILNQRNPRSKFEPKADKELLSCPFDEAPSAEDKTDSSDPIIPVPCSLNQVTAATTAYNSLCADETLEAEDSP